MSKLLILLSLVSFNVFAQYNDGYHVEPRPTCSTGECLMVDGRPIEIVTKEDRSGFIYTEVSSEASITDVLVKENEVCYQGSKLGKLRSILKALIGNTNRYYYQGGHDSVLSFNSKLINNGLEVSLKVESDYPPYKYEINSSIRICE